MQGVGPGVAGAAAAAGDLGLQQQGSEEARDGKPAADGDAPSEVDTVVEVLTPSGNPADAGESSNARVAASVLAGDVAALSMDSDNPGSFLFLQAMRVSWMQYTVCVPALATV